MENLGAEVLKIIFNLTSANVQNAALSLSKNVKTLTGTFYLGTHLLTNLSFIVKMNRKDVDSPLHSLLAMRKN